MLVGLLLLKGLMDVNQPTRSLKTGVPTEFHFKVVNKQFLSSLFLGRINNESEVDGNCAQLKRAEELVSGHLFFHNFQLRPD